LMINSNTSMSYSISSTYSPNLPI